MAVERIPVPDGTSVVLRLVGASASMTVLAGASDDIEVDADRAHVTVTGATPEDPATEVRVTTKRMPVTVRCPAGTEVVISLASGHAELRGPCGAARITTRSGSVRAASVASLDARTGSGRIEVEHCAGECRVLTRSGTIEVGAAGDLHAVTKSGRLVVGMADTASISAGHGRIDLGVSGAGPVRVRTMSGSVAVSVPTDRRPRVSFRSRSGSLDTDVEDGEDFDLAIRTMSASTVVRTR